MRSFRAAAALCLIAILHSIILIESAYAYLDPGTGGIWLQAIVAAVAGGLLFLQSYWQRFLSFFKGHPGKSPEDKSARGV